MCTSALHPRVCASRRRDDALVIGVTPSIFGFSKPVPRAPCYTLLLTGVGNPILYSMNEVEESPCAAARARVGGGWLRGQGRAISRP